MKTIAVFSDVHGNYTALAAMVADAQAAGAEEYWFLGDLLMPGPGVADVWELFHQLPVTKVVRGNWDDLVIHGARGEMRPKKPAHVYFARLAQYVAEHLPAGAVDEMAAWPLAVNAQIGNLPTGLSHNLPDLNMGQDLFPTNPSKNFDQLFDDEADVAIYAHVHHQLLRYGTDERIVLNPGSVGEPFNGRPRLQTDTRAQYLLIEADEAGIAGLNYRHVAYDRQAEVDRARQADLPYLEVYERHLQTGRVYTHDQDYLAGFNQKYGYEEEYQRYCQRVQAARQPQKKQAKKRKKK